MGDRSHAHATGPRRLPNRLRAALLTSAFAWSVTGHAYPEFQHHIQSSSGQVVSCALCHSHAEGPDGSKHGQIGGLSARELESLAQSRGQLEPGAIVDSPILNDFGDHLVASLGRNRLIALRTTPDLLASAIADDHDQDQDGITDARELIDGTDPTDPRHGHPALLLIANARRHRAELVLASVATLLGLFGLSRLLRSFAASQNTRVAERVEAKPQPPSEPASLAK